MRNVGIAFLVATILTSCAANRALNSDQKSKRASAELAQYPGVDSTVAREALSYADRILADTAQMDAADSLFQRAKISFECADTLSSVLNHSKKDDPIFDTLCHRWTNQIGLTGKTRNLFLKLNSRRKLEYIFSIADEEASQAKLLNPFNLNTRGLLVQINMMLGNLTSRADYYVTAVNELENLLLVDKSNPDVYTRLAECHYALGNWAKCDENFREAETVLHAVSQFKMIENPGAGNDVDTSKWVYLLRGQGEARAKLYDAEGATSFLTQAYELTDSETLRTELNNFLSWIKWDDGNIRASELRDEVHVLEQSADYKQAREKYIDLLNHLKTQRTSNEINWKIASIEYQHLNRQKDAVERLFGVLKNIPRDDPAVPDHERYRKDYAAMCFSLAMDYSKMNEMRLAYIYLRQASKIEWDYRARSYVQMALLSQSNPDETIRNCTFALSESQQLSSEEIYKIHQMLFYAHKQKGNYTDARHYFKLLADKN